MPVDRPCPACGDQGPAREILLDEVMFGTGETFPYWECATCASLYIQSVPDNLGDYYSSENYYSLDIDPEEVLGRPGVAQVVGSLGASMLRGRGVLGSVLGWVPVENVQAMLRKFRSVSVGRHPLPRDARVLDVGAGTGLLVYALALSGMRDVTGIDPFLEEDVAFANGARILKRDLAEISDSFDLVMLHHALEHVPDPLGTLEQVRERLAPGGRAIIRIPTVSSEVYETYGPDWYGTDAPRHLTLFSREGMNTLAAKAGFRVAKVSDDGTSSQFWASEQVRAGIPYGSERSHFRDPGNSMFSTQQIKDWERRGAELNRQGRSDQAAWVLVPA